MKNISQTSNNIFHHLKQKTSDLMKSNEIIP